MLNHYDKYQENGLTFELKQIQLVLIINFSISHLNKGRD